MATESQVKIMTLTEFYKQVNEIARSICPDVTQAWATAQAFDHAGEMRCSYNYSVWIGGVLHVHSCEMLTLSSPEAALERLRADMTRYVAVANIQSTQSDIDLTPYVEETIEPF